MNKMNQKNDKAIVKVMYTIFFDYGKPDRWIALSDYDLELKLRHIGLMIISSDYPHIDIMIFDEKGDDISESQYIEKLIGEIMEETYDGE